MNRQEMFYIQNNGDRQTGRTTLMLTAAAKAYSNGNQVSVITATAQHVVIIRRMIVKLGLHLPLNVVTTETHQFGFDPKMLTFVDHYVLESNLYLAQRKIQKLQQQLDDIAKVAKDERGN